MIDQIINNGNIDINNIDLNYDSIIFSTVAGATTMPSIIDSYNTAKYSWKAKQNLKNQLKDAKTINRQNKIQGRIDKNNNKLKNHIYFQTTNKMLNKAIDYEVENLQGDNKWNTHTIMFYGNI